jgi:hypothetical protein
VFPVRYELGQAVLSDAAVAIAQLIVSDITVNSCRPRRRACPATCSAAIVAGNRSTCKWVCVVPRDFVILKPLSLSRDPAV